MLRVTNMSAAVLCVYLDSASDLPQVRAQSKPDPFVILSVGKSTEQTNAIRRTDAPVWEQGFTFLVANPENDTLKLKLIDQKTEKDLGEFTYILSSLLAKPQLELVSQPFQLQKSGPTSKIILSLALKILKRAPPTAENDSINVDRENISLEVPQITAEYVETSNSAQHSPDVKLAEFPPDIIDTTGTVKEEIFLASVRPLSSVSPGGSSSDEYSGSQLIHRHRRASASSTAGNYNLGRIQTTLRYSVQRQRLTVIIHKIA